MIEPRVPPAKKCFNPVLQAVQAHNGEATNIQIYNWVVKHLDLSDEQLAVLRKPGKPGYGTKIGHHIDFAKTILKNVGLLDNPKRRVWALTAVGKKARAVDPNDIQRENARLQKEKKEKKERGQGQKGPRPSQVNPSQQETPNPKLRERIRLPSENVSVSESQTNDVIESTHEQIQWILLSLGNEMGLDLWVANNDRNKSFQGKRFAEIPRLRNHLPVQFSQRAQKIVELIDVLWIDGNSIIAAFEIEHTTSIYSGLLRMSDLIALQPNLNINLFIVAPDSRRDKVMSEINRPTFENLKLRQRCRYVGYAKLTQKIDQATRGGFLRHLSVSILDELAEDMSKSNSPIRR